MSDLEHKLPLIYQKLVDLEPAEFEEWYVMTLVENQLLGTLDEYIESTKVVFEHALRRECYDLFYWAMDKGIPAAPLLRLLCGHIPNDSSFSNEQEALVEKLRVRLTAPSTPSELHRITWLVPRNQTYRNIPFWIDLQPTTQYKVLDCREFREATATTIGTLLQECVTWLNAQTTQHRNIINWELMTELAGNQSWLLTDTGYVKAGEHRASWIRTIFRGIDRKDLEVVMLNYLKCMTLKPLMAILTDNPEMVPFLKDNFGKFQLEGTLIGIEDLNKFHLLTGLGEQLVLALIKNNDTRTLSLELKELSSCTEQGAVDKELKRLEDEVAMLLTYAPMEWVARRLTTWDLYYREQISMQQRVKALIAGQLGILPKFGGNYASMFRGMSACTSQSPRVTKLILQWLDSDKVKLTSNAYSILKEVKCSKALSEEIFARLPDLNAGDFINFSRYLNGDSLAVLASRIKPTARHYELALANAISTNNGEGICHLITKVTPTLGQLKQFVDNGQVGAIKAYLDTKPTVDIALQELLYFTFVKNLSRAHTNEAGELLVAYITPEVRTQKKLAYLVNWFGKPATTPT